MTNGLRRSRRRKRAGVALSLAAMITFPGAALPQAAWAQVTAAAPAGQDVAILTREQVDHLLAAPDSVVFIDVRRPDELAAIGGLPVYLNVQASELDRFLAYIPRDRTVVTVS